MPIETYRTDDYAIFNLYHGIGQAIGIKAWTGRTILVDAGGPLNIRPLANQPITYLPFHAIPYSSWVSNQWRAIDAILITHAHTDHYIGLAGLYQELTKKTDHCPIIVADPIAQFYIGKQFVEARVSLPDCLKAETLGKKALVFGQTGDVHSFYIHCIPTVHSTWQTVSYVISIPKVNPPKPPEQSRNIIIVMSDWKWSSGQYSAEKEAVMRDFMTLAAKQDISALVTEALNCDRRGHAPSEDIAQRALAEIVPKCRGRIFFTCNPRNFERIINFLELAHANDRLVKFSGQSMRETSELLVKLERQHQRSLPKSVDIFHKYISVNIKEEAGMFQFLPKREQAFVITGHGAQEWSGLWQLVHVSGRWQIDREDTIIVSSDPPPGNEEHWVHLLWRIAQTKARVYVTPNAHRNLEWFAKSQAIRLQNNLIAYPDLNPTGHAYRDDILKLVELLRPRDHLVLTHWPESKRSEVETFQQTLRQRGYPCRIPREK